MPVNPKSLQNLTGGSRKGSTNKVTRELGAMIDEALEKAGGANYLLARARDPDTMGAFLALVGKRLPRDMKIDATVTGTHAALTEAAGAVPAAVVAAMLEAGKTAMAKEQSKAKSVGS